MENRPPQDPPKRPESPRRPNGAGAAPTPPWLWLFLIAVVGLIIYSMTPPKDEVSYNWFVEQVDDDHIERMTIAGLEVKGKLREPQLYDQSGISAKPQKIETFTT